MSFGPDSYIGQLHASLAELLDPRVVQSAKHMHSPKALRDFIVSWCFFWQCCLPPFQNGGARGQWVCDQWEELPMHEIESADGSVLSHGAQAQWKMAIISLTAKILPPTLHKAATRTMSLWRPAS